MKIPRLQITVALRTFGLWSGFAALGYGIAQVSRGAVDPLWLAVTALMALLFQTGVTVGYHRLFAHRYFQCHRAWHWFFAIIGCASLSISPVEWSVVHLAHHKFADTDREPHIRSWRYLFRFSHPPLHWISPQGFRMLRDPMHHFFHKYSAAVFWLICIVLLSTSRTLFIYAFAAPVGVTIFITYMNNIFAHYGNKPRIIWPLEFLLPTAGEWLHATHHAFPKRICFATKPWHVDVGYWVIQRIRNDRL